MGDTGRSYDLIVIGGGINGAGVTLDASLRGLDVLLLEARDFCSRSTRSFAISPTRASSSPSTITRALGSEPL